MGNLRDRKVACSASDRQGSYFEFCVGGQCHLTIFRRFPWPSLYVHKGALNPPAFHSISNLTNVYRRIYMYSITLTQFNFCVVDTNSCGWKFQFDILAMERWIPKCGYFPWFGTVCLMNDLGRQLITWMRNLSFPTKAMRFWMDCKRLVIWESFLDLQINWAIWDAPVSCSSATIQGKGGCIGAAIPQQTRIVVPTLV